jgi:hypothetical protein
MQADESSVTFVTFGERRSRTREGAREAIAAVGTLVLAVGTLSGCGSTSSNTTASSGAATAGLDTPFVAKVEQLCAANLKEYPPTGTFPYTDFNPHGPDPSQLPAVGAYFAENQRGDGPLKSAIQNLGEPTTGAGAWAKLEALALAFLTNAETQKAYAQAGNAAGFVASVNQNATITSDLKNAATRAGLPVTGACAQVF